MFDAKSRLFDIWFSLCCGAGNREFPRVLECFDSTFDLYMAEGSELESLPCSDKLKTRLANKNLDEARRILRRCDETGMEVLFWKDEDYPIALRSLQDPPALLYYMGKFPDLRGQLGVGVVGTRRMTEYGKRTAYRIGYELASAEAVVISGMALGIDGVAAGGAILAGGTTVAVLGCGLDRPYPAEHNALFEEIVRTGVAVSEYPPGTPPNRWQFPQRNRIISGLSRCTVVVEAALRSGSLITAHDAILQGREVFAFPGNVGDPTASGTNELLSQGATMILRSRDLLERYNSDDILLNMDALERAERESLADEEGLADLGVCLRAERSKSSSAPATSARKEDTPPARRGSGSRSAHSIPARGDTSEQILKSLPDIQRRMFEALPLDHAVNVDYLTREGFAVGEIMSTMMQLEIKGLTVSLPGGLYARK